MTVRLGERYALYLKAFASSPDVYDENDRKWSWKDFSNLLDDEVDAELIDYVENDWPGEVEDSSYERREKAEEAAREEYCNDWDDGPKDFVDYWVNEVFNKRRERNRKAEYGKPGWVQAVYVSQGTWKANSELLTDAQKRIITDATWRSTECEQDGYGNPSAYVDDYMAREYVSSELDDAQIREISHIVRILTGYLDFELHPDAEARLRKAHPDLDDILRQASGEISTAEDTPNLFNDEEYPLPDNHEVNAASMAKWMDGHGYPDIAQAIRRNESTSRDVASDLLVESLVDGCAFDLALLEATRMEVLQQKYPDIKPELIADFAKADPTSNIDPNTGELRKVGGYTDWLIRQYRKMSPARQARIGEDLPIIAGELKLYHQNKAKPLDPTTVAELKAHAKGNPNPKDINQLDLAAVSLLADAHRMAEPSEKDTSNKANATKVYEDKEWLVVIPRDEEASCKYGAGTRWCTAASGYNYFDTYNAQGPLIIVIKKKTDTKVQLHFQSGQFMDASDSAISLSELARSLPEAVREAIVEIEPAAEMTLLPGKTVAKIEAGKRDFPSMDFRQLLHLFFAGWIKADAFNKIIASSTSPNADVDKQLFAEESEVWVGMKDPVDLADIVESRRHGARSWAQEAIQGDLIIDSDTLDTRYLLRDLPSRIRNLAMEVAALNPDLDPERDSDEEIDLEEDPEVIEALEMAYRYGDESGQQAFYTEHTLNALTDELGGGTYSWSKGRSPYHFCFQLGRVAARTSLPDYLKIDGEEGDQYGAEPLSGLKDVFNLLVSIYTNWNGGGYTLPNAHGYPDFDDKYFEEMCIENLENLKHEREKNAPEPEAEPADVQITTSELPSPEEP